MHLLDCLFYLTISSHHFQVKKCNPSNNNNKSISFCIAFLADSTFYVLRITILPSDLKSILQ